MSLPIVHAGFAWLTVEREAIPALDHDRDLKKLLLVSPAPGLYGCRAKDREKVLTRLAKLGLAPRIVGGGA